MQILKFARTFLTPGLLSCVLVSGLLTACARSGEDGGPTANTEEAAHDPYANWTDAEVDSENIADETETNLSLDNLDESLVKFNEAVKLNPKNGRADLWAAFITVQLQMRGFLARIRPFIEAMPDGNRRYNEILDSHLSDNEAMRRFYFKGPADILTADEFQDFVDLFNLRLGDLRSALARQKNSEIRLLVPTSFSKSTNSSAIGEKAKRCEGSSWGPIKYQPSDCSLTGTEFLMNRADIEVMSSALAGYQAMIALYNAYRLSPELIQAVMDRNSDDTPMMIRVIKIGAKLRSNNQMSIFDSGSRDVALAAKYIYNNQKVACPKGHESRKNRPGYVFGSGFCTGDIPVDLMKRTTQLIDQVLAMQPITLIEGAGNIERIDFDLAKFAAKPVGELGDFGPVRTDSCGSQYPNLTPLKVYTTKGDLEKVFRPGSGPCRRGPK